MPETENNIEDKIIKESGSIDETDCKSPPPLSSSDEKEFSQDSDEILHQPEALIPLTLAQTREIIIEMARESWRFSALFRRLLQKLEETETNRYLNQYRWFIKKLDEALAKLDLQLVDVQNHAYDPGMPVKVVNIDDFSANDPLVVDQMLEPIITGKDGLVISGTITVRKK
ncbi:MAG: hypothetical protein LBF22_13125 [Deltaproteobacteria bacterium]|jgi:hypothetical protein|nr:hypothetical protein [Deltaproteobacteria bacterium]